MNYLAYIDGSHHSKSQTSGWGFAILKNDMVIHECYGTVPETWILSYEYYAFAKLVQFCLENNLNHIEMKTDLLGMEIQYKELNETQIVDEARKYISTLPPGSLQLSVAHISRKYNRVADKLSRLYLMNLYKEERNLFLKTHGKAGSKKINFLHMNELLHSSRALLKSAESRVLHAVKKHHLIFDLTKEGESFVLRIMWNQVKNEFDILETLELPEDYLAPLMDKILSYSNEHKKIMLSLEDKELFHQLIGLCEKNFSIDLQIKYKELLDSLEELFLHSVNIFPKKKKNRTRNRIMAKNTLNNEVKGLDPTLYERAKTQDKYFQIVMGIDIRQFTQQHKRKPSKEERSMLAVKRKENLAAS